jgi:hypothetical protein
VQRSAGEQEPVDVERAAPGNSGGELRDRRPMRRPRAARRVVAIPRELAVRSACPVPPGRVARPIVSSRSRLQARVLPLGAAAPCLLDPFSFGVDLAQKRTMATETLRLLLPRMSEERESAMIQAVGAVAGTERPSLGKVITYLVDVIAHASSRKIAWGAVLSMPLRSLRANWETRYSRATDSRCS